MFESYNETSPLTSLSKDLLIYVLTFLNPKSLVQASRTCKLLNGIAFEKFMIEPEWTQEINKEIKVKIIKIISKKQVKLKAKQESTYAWLNMYDTVLSKTENFDFKLRFYPAHESKVQRDEINSLDRLIKTPSNPDRNYRTLKVYEKNYDSLESQIMKTKAKMCCFMTCRTAITVGMLACVIFAIGFTVLIVVTVIAEGAGR